MQKLHLLLLEFADFLCYGSVSANFCWPKSIEAILDDMIVEANRIFRDFREACTGNTCTAF